MMYAVKFTSSSLRALFVAREDAISALKAIPGATGGYLAVQVAFPGSAKAYTYLVNEEVAIGDRLVVSTADGNEFVRVLPAPNGETSKTGYASFILRKQDMVFPLERYKTAEKA